MKYWAQSVKESWGDSPAPKKLETVKLDATPNTVAFKGKKCAQGVTHKDYTKAPRESYVTWLVNVAPNDRGHLIGTAGLRVRALQTYFGVQIKVFWEPSELVQVRGPEAKVRDAVHTINEMYVAPRKLCMAQEEKERELNRARQRMMAEMKKIQIGYDKQRAWLVGEIDWMKNTLID